jgi:plasmid stabilization system protein ParE
VSIEYTTPAEWDILDAVDDLTDSLGPAVALAFRQRLQRTLSGLEAMPYTGSPVEPPPAAYPDLRFRPVSRFQARVVYYQPTPTGIRVVRVMHARQHTGGAFDD